MTIPFAVGVEVEVAERRVRTSLVGLALPQGVRLSLRRVDLNEAPVAIYAVTRVVGVVLAEGDPVGRFASRLERVAGVARVVSLGIDGTQAGLAPTRVRLDGQPVLALEVIKRAGSNTLDVARAVDTLVRDTQSRGEINVTPVRAEAPFIREATAATVEALCLAIALSVLVIHPFLRSGAATAISALAIPTSLLGTFLVMELAGFKFETITLLALALVMGIIVDDAIVDVENISRHLPLAETPGLAVRRATDEIGLTVTAATLTIVAVFLPVGLMGGVVGTFFRPFGLTISAAVLTSLLVARTLTPVLAARWLKAGDTRPIPALWAQISDTYRRLLGWSIKHHALVLVAAGVSFAAGIAIIPLIPQGFIPALDRGEFDVRYALTPGSGLASADMAALQLSQLIGSDPDVLRVLSVAGSPDGDPNRGVVHVILKPARASKTQAVQARVRRALAPEWADRVSVENVPIIAVAAQQPLQVTLVSEDSAALVAATKEVVRRVSGWAGVADLAVSGIGSDGNGTRVRHEGHPAAVISGNLTAGYALGAISRRLSTEIPAALPPGVKLALEGESAQAAEVFGDFSVALGLAFLGVVTVLMLLFRSWQDPFNIAISLPLSAVGAMLGLFVARSDFGVISLLGLVFLVGLVNKNAIILVDRINQLRAAGLDRDNAILEAGYVRLRPIAMTTGAAVLGMLPIALGFGAGAELRAPMAVAIIGGLLTSTLLSLVVVPVVYRLLDRLQPRFRRGLDNDVVADPRES